MTRTFAITIGLLIIGLTAAGQSTGSWTTLFDGKSLAAFDVVGDANWQVTDGLVEHKGHTRGPIALQYGAGTVKFRNVQIRPL